jgi:hypothetical protein
VIKTARARTDTSEIAADIVAAVNRLRLVASQADESAWAEIETFIAIALKVFAKTNPSKLRDAARTVEIHARINNIECLDDGEDQ